MKPQTTNPSELTNLLDGYSAAEEQNMDIGEPKRVWESEPIEEPFMVPEEPNPVAPEPQREQEPVPAQ